MPEYTGDDNIVLSVLDGRTDRGGTAQTDIDSSSILRGMSLARWTEGLMFPTSFQVDLASGNQIRLGSGNVRNDIGIVDIAGDFPTVVQLQRDDTDALPVVTFPRPPLSGSLVYRFGVVVYNRTGARYANLYWDTSTGSGNPSNSVGFLHLYNVTVPFGLHTTLTYDRVAGVSTQTRTSL